MPICWASQGRMKEVKCIIILSGLQGSWDEYDYSDFFASKC